MSMQHMQVRVPGPLAERVHERADASGLAVSDVLRAAICREVERPIDRKAKSFVQLWVDGVLDAEEAETAEKEV